MPDAISCCSSFVACFKDSIMNEMKYLFNLRANMRNLGKAADGLELTKNEVEGMIKSAREARKDEVPTERVQKWLEKVQTVESEVTIIEGDHNRLQMCCGGCPLNCWSGYKISKRAADVLAEVKELLEEGKLDAVTEKVVPAVQPLHDSTLPLPATDILLKNAIQYLKDETVGVIGIRGMGGVGKTTLLKRINNHPEVESAGYRVIWAVVSQEFNPYKLQRDIAERVGLHLEEQDATTELQAERLRHFLKDQKLLLLLDDIWKAFDLKELGIPSLGSSDSKVPRSKVVFTTRSEKVCDQMAALNARGGHTEIRVECLTPEEAWDLFFNEIGPIVQNIIKSDGRVRGHAETVAKKCAGLPLALVLIARAMSGTKTWREWEVAVNSINDFRLPEIFRDEDSDPLYPVLKFSYDRLLNDQTRQCFLRCALWPEDFEIPKEDVIRCWLGMGFVADFHNIIDAVNEGHIIIERLKGAAMLEETTDAGFRICVKLHDIIRGMALWIASDCGKKRNKCIVRTGVNIEAQVEEEKWREAEIISLMYSGIKGPQQFPTCPNLKALMLRGTNLYEDLDVDGLIQIPALTYVDLSYARWLPRPSHIKSISNLVGLQCLDLSGGQRSLSLPKELVNLTNLKYLFIRDGWIDSLPRGLISGLQKLEILDLSNTTYWGWEEEGEASVAELGCINEAGGLKGVGIRLPPSLLQRLSSTNHPHVPPLWHLQIEDDYNTTKTLRLSKSLFPGGIFPRSLQSLELFQLEEVEEMFIAGGKENKFDNLEVLQFRILWRLEKISWEGGVVPQVLFQNLSSLAFYGCKELKEVSWIAQFPYLEILIIEYCDEMEQVIGGAEAEAEDDGEEAAQEQDGIEEAEAAENNTPLKILPNLKFLQLWGLSKLRSFCSSQMTLPSLQRVDIEDCPQLNRFFLKKTNAQVNLLPTKARALYFHQLKEKHKHHTSIKGIYHHQLKEKHEHFSYNHKHLPSLTQEGLYSNDSVTSTT